MGILASSNQDPSNLAYDSLVLEKVGFKNINVAIQGFRDSNLLAGTQDSMRFEGVGSGSLL